MKKGFLILQMDGLPYEELKGAITKGYAPFLKSLLKSKKFKLEKMYCGLPALRLQTGIMYGKYPDIPGLTWFDKRKFRFVSVINVKDLKELERKLPNGILRKGISIGTIFSGGSKKGFSSLATLNLSALLKRFPKYEIAFYFMLAPFVLLIDFVVSVITKLKRGAVFEGAFTDKIFHHCTLDLARREIEKSCPFLFINFSGYDQRSHRLGKKSVFTKGVIKDIDEKIEKIYNLAKESKSVDYDLFVLSDHGQIESTPFKDCFGETLKEVIERNLKIEVIEGGEAEIEIIMKKMEKMIDEIPWLRKVSWPLRVLAKKYYQRFHVSFTSENIILMSWGDFAHIYFNMKKRQVLYEEIEKVYPEFLNLLLKHKGIRLLMVASRKGVKIMGKKGEILVNRKEKLKGKDPLAGVFDRDFILSLIRKLTKMKSSGDVIMFSSKINNKVVNFGNQFSCHDGIEKDEQEIFVISPSSCKYSFQGIKEPKKLYKFFKKYLK